MGGMIAKFPIKTTIKRLTFASQPSTQKVSLTTPRSVRADVTQWRLTC